jgi:hypothetical protein
VRGLRVFVLPVFLAAITFTCAAQSGKVEPLGPIDQEGVSDAVKAVLEPKGYRLKLDDGSVAGEIWLRSGIVAGPKKDVAGVIYPRLPESVLVAVVVFPQNSTDYRGQPIKAGTYNLRYELIPNDGNHLGVAPNRDFLLLVPSSADADPKATFKFEDLVQLSKKATGSNHPGPMSLVQAEGASAPDLSMDSEEHWVFSSALKLEGGEELPFALVVKGTAPQ